MEIEPQHQGARDHVADKICYYEWGGKQKECGFGAPALEAVGISQDEQGHNVGDDAQCHGQYHDDDATCGGLHQGEVPLLRQPLHGHPGLHLPSTVIGEVGGERGGWGVVVAQS